MRWINGMVTSAAQDLAAKGRVAMAAEDEEARRGFEVSETLQKGGPPSAGGEFDIHNDGIDRLPGRPAFPSLMVAAHSKQIIAASELPVE